MKRILFLLALCIGLLGLVQSTHAQVAQGQSRFRPAFFDVFVADDVWNMVKHVRADANGRFDLGTLKAGVYHFWLEIPGNPNYKVELTLGGKQTIMCPAIVGRPGIASNTGTVMPKNSKAMMLTIKDADFQNVFGYVVGY